MLVQVGIAAATSNFVVAEDLIRALVDRGVSTVFVPLEQLWGALQGDKAPFRCLALVGGQAASASLIQRIREDSNVPFLLVVGDSFTRERKARLIAAGADDCAEAAELEVVLARLFSCLQRSTSGTRPCAVADDSCASSGGPSLEFDFPNQRVSVGGVLVELTRMELSLLKYLADHPNRWLSHTEVREAVFGASCRSDSTLVRVHLHNIRRKLGTAADLLRTERYRGTMLLLEGPATAQSA